VEDLDFCLYEVLPIFPAKRHYLNKTLIFAKYYSKYQRYNGKSFVNLEPRKSQRRK
jgi:hypothetical protein